MIKQILLLFLCSACLAQRPLGTVSQCTTFTVTIPEGYPITGSLDVRTPNGTINAVDVFFSGSQGTSLWGAGPFPIEPFFQSLLSSGHQIVQVKWNTPWLASPTGVQTGQVALACRPATLIKWIHDHYPAPKFNLIGTSAGSAALTYALADYGIVADKVVIDSGPPFMELRKACEHIAGYEFGGEKPLVDMGYGFQSNGPCVRADASFEDQWNANSIESGGVYQYPAIEIHVIYGLSDSVYIQNRARDYAALLGLTNDEVHPVAGMGHGVQRSQDGLNILLGILTQ